MAAVGVVWLVFCILAGGNAASVNPGSEMADYETIIVGMGAAGTTAASELAKAGVRVLALEAMDRIGGRVNTVPFGDGVVEMGAEWIHGTTPSRTYDLATKNGVKLVEQDISLEVYKSDGSKANSTLINEVLDQAMAAVNEQRGVNEPLGQFLTRKIKDHLKMKYPREFEDQDFVTELLNLMDVIVGNYESSDSWNDVTTSSVYEELGGHQHVSWGGSGYSTLFDILLNKYNNGTGLPTLTIKLNSEVTKITYSDDPSKKVLVTVKDGTTYTADNVIVTVSLGVLKAKHEHLFAPKLSEPKRTAIEKLSIGVMDKVIFEFETPWWPIVTRAFYGFLWKGEDRSALADEDYWVTRVLGASRPLGCKRALTVWTSGDVGKMVETMDEQVVKTKLMALLRRFMGKGIEIPEPTAMIRTTWFHNPYTLGSYTYDNLLSPQYPTSRSDLGAPITDSAGTPRVLFAGEATEPHHFSTVHGAADTGHREAQRILARRAKSHLAEIPHYETIIVGMGAAGTTAASELAGAGVKVLGLEAMDRIGGRVNTVPFGDGVVEMGAEWIHGTVGSRTYELAIQNGVKLLNQDTTVEVFNSDGTKGNSSLVNELMTVGMEAVGEEPTVPEPLGQFVTKKVNEYIKEHYPALVEDKEFIAEFLHLLDLCVDSLESSNSWNDVTTSRNYHDLEGSQSMSWAGHGYKTLFDILLNKYNNGPGLPTLTIKLNSEVTKITYSDDPSKKVLVTVKDGTTYTADNVIVTVSLGVLKVRYKTLFSSPLPPSKQTAIDVMSIGFLGKVIFLFPEHWWQTTEHPICFMWTQEDKQQLPKEDAWLLDILGVATPMGSMKALTVWTVGDTGRMIETMDEKVLKTKLMGLIRRFMGKGIEVPEPTTMIRSTWFHNPYTLGSYSFDNLLTPQHPTARADLAAPIADSAGNPRVLFAGEATEPHQSATVHGATNTGHREATRLLERRAKSHL